MAIESFDVSSSVPDSGDHVLLDSSYLMNYVGATDDAKSGAGPKAKAKAEAADVYWIKYAAAGPSGPPKIAPRSHYVSSMVLQEFLYASVSFLLKEYEASRKRKPLTILSESGDKLRKEVFSEFDASGLLDTSLDNLHSTPSRRTALSRVVPILRRLVLDLSKNGAITFIRDHGPLEDSDWDLIERLTGLECIDCYDIFLALTALRHDQISMIVTADHGFKQAEASIHSLGKQLNVHLL